MYINLLFLLGELQRRTNVTIYNIPPEKMIEDIRMLPADFDLSDPSLRSDIVYVCEYRQLTRYDPHTEFPPLICVVEALAITDSSLFISRCMAVVTGSTVVETLLALLNTVYACGNKSSPLNDISQRLLRCIGMPALLDEGFLILGNPIVITTPEQEILASTDPAKVSAPAYREILAQNSLPVGHPSLAPNETVPSYSEPVLFESEGIGDCPSVFCKPMTVSGRNLGYLHVLNFNRPFVEEDFYVAELLANLIALDLNRRVPTKYQCEDPDRQVIQFLRDILDVVSGDTEETLRREESLSVSFTEHLYAMVIHTKPDMPIRRPSANSNFYALSRTISSLFPNCFSFIYKNSVFTLFNCKSEIGDIPAYLAPLLAMPETDGLLIGVSNVFSSALDIREYAYQARKAIQLGCIVHPGNRLFLYQDYTLYYMAELCLHNDRTENLCSPALLRLMEYCQKNDCELLETLRVYLKCNRSKLDTSKEMFLHINTVKYRISQIQSIMGVDLNRPDDVLWISFSLILLDYQEKIHSVRTPELDDHL